MGWWAMFFDPDGIPGPLDPTDFSLITEAAGVNGESSFTRESYDAGEFLSVHEYENVVAWADRFYARPAVQRGVMVNRTHGPAGMQLWERHDASDFETKTQDKMDTAAE